MRLDYKLGERTRLYLGSTINRLTDHDTDRITSFTGNAAAVAPGFTDTFTTILPTAASTLNVQADTAYKDARTNYHQIGAVHKRPGLELDVNLYKSDSKSNYAGQRNFGYTLRGIGFTVDQRTRADFPIATQTAGPSLADLASFTESRYTINRRAGSDNYRGVSFNAKKSFTTPFPSYVKLGGKIREQRRVSAYLDVNNVLGEYETGQDRGPRPSQRRVLSPGFFAGVNARL